MIINGDDGNKNDTKTSAALACLFTYTRVHVSL